MSFAAASDAGRACGHPGGTGGLPPEGTVQSRVVTGHLPAGAADFVHLPVEVPRGVRQIAVSYSYDRPAVPPGTQGNACDIGIFDQHGTDVGGCGFRGWSGGARTEFAISAEVATPGYRAGPALAITNPIWLGRK